MKRAALAVLLIAGFAACKKAPQAPAVPVKETVAGFGMIDYTPPQGAFMCRLPGDWKGEEDKTTSGNDTVSLIGPLKDKRLAFIHILHYRKGDQWTDAKKYADSFWEITPNNEQPALEKTQVNGNEVIRFNFQQPYRKNHSKKVEYMERLDYALIPTKDGFFELWHSAPADCYKETLPVFEAVVRSFKPKS